MLPPLVGIALVAVATAARPASDAPVVLTVAGSDSGGGAGIQADLKTCEALGAFGTTAIVALTAQNTLGVQSAVPMTVGLVHDQIDSVLDDMGAHAVKTGMLPTAEIIHAVTAQLDVHRASVRVIDPVFVAASGHTLVGPEALSALKSRLIPTATVLTPNMPEAGTLLGRDPPSTVDEMRAAAADLLSLGAKAVVLKGGRLPHGEMVDIYADREGEGGGVRLVELRHERQPTSNTHGAGCTLAAAIAAELAKQVHAGVSPLDVLGAVRAARDYLASVFAASVNLSIGMGERGPLNHARAPWRSATGTGLAARLWSDARVESLANASLRNGFVTSLADGSLSAGSFAGYVAQDKFFLDAFAQAYTLALAKLPATDTYGVSTFAALVKGVVDELSLHAAYAAKWGADMSAVTPTAECAAYVDFLKSVTATEDVAACAAAMVPCMRLYAHIGQQLKSAAAEPGAPSAGAYQEWIDTYADAGFEELAATLERLLDRYTFSASAERVVELRDLYVKAMELELDFFDAWSPTRTAKDEI